jgi:hypothetical protein
MRPLATACILAGITLLLYGFRLNAPLSPAEAAVVQQAQTPGTPLFFHEQDERWLMPLPVYATAMTRSVVDNDYAVRVASTAMAALDVALIFVCARVAFGGDAPGLVAAILLMFMPAHLALGRSGTGSIYQLPFVLFGLWNVIDYLTHARRWRLVIAGLGLGIGMYSHPTAPLTMTFLVAVFAAVLAYRRRALGDIAALGAAFLACFVPAAIWFALNPESYPDTFGRWVVLKAHVRYPLDLVSALVNWNTLGTRVSLYWGFFDPAWLFFDDTHRASPLLLLFLPPLIWGIARSRALWPDVYPLVCLGAIIAPLAGSTFGEPHSLPNAAALLPFAALLAAAGVTSALAHRDRWRRAMVIAFAIGLVTEFSLHYLQVIA